MSETPNKVTVSKPKPVPGWNVRKKQWDEGYCHYCGRSFAAPGAPVSRHWEDGHYWCSGYERTLYRMDGGPISPERAVELAERVRKHDEGAAAQQRAVAERERQEKELQRKLRSLT